MASGFNAANGRIYLVGGSDAVDPSSARATTWEYDPAANTFTTRAPIPHAVRGTAFGVIGGHLYLAGGRDSLGDVVDLVWDYSIAANTWTAKAAMPSPTNAAGSAAASGKLWSFGGESASGPVQTTAAYDPVTNTWASGPSLNEARTLDRRNGDREHARGCRRVRDHELHLLRPRCWTRVALPARSRRRRSARTSTA